MNEIAEDRFLIAEELPDDHWEVEALYDLCFAPGREALSSYRLREGVDRIGALSLTARDRWGILAGAIRVWPVQIEGKDALLMGPIAVHPTRQGEGLGAMLINDCLRRARAGGWARALLVGDEPYYRRFGFSRLDHVRMPPPTNPDRVLGVELMPSGWIDVRGDVTKYGAAEDRLEDQLDEREGTGNRY